MSQETDLSIAIRKGRMADSHEHLQRSDAFHIDRLDILGALFENYVTADLVVAGADPSDVESLFERESGSISERFSRVQEAWKRCMQTGYGEAVRIAAAHFYQLSEITPEGLEEAQSLHEELMANRSRKQILEQDALLDHVQIDDFTLPIIHDEEDEGFFLYDMSLASLVSGRPDLQELKGASGVEVKDLATLEEALEGAFEAHAKFAVACKTQHAYERTLAWQSREGSDAETVLAAYIRDPEGVTYADRLVLGDWCLDLCSTLAGRHGLPIKIHTGYYAGHSRMPLDYISCRHLCGLLAAHLETDFVLMHNSYPYSEELISLAKHYPNAYVDMCWAWSINPFETSRFLRSALHAVPVNKVFVFGADTGWPTASYAYAAQARRWLTNCLEQEVKDGFMTERDAMQVADRVMLQNQYDCFPLLSRRAGASRQANPISSQARLQ